MAYDLVSSVTIRPDGVAPFLEQIALLAAACREKQDRWHFTAHQTLFGESMTMHFASQAESFAHIEELGTVEELWLRVLGDAAGADAFRRANDSIQQVQQTVSVDRPELSYADGIGAPADYPYAVVTSARARPGHADAAEELIRKLAEAIPKVDDPARILTYQVMFGEIGAYWTVRPLRNLADLDRQLPAPELLNAAFGNAEGGLIWRSGSEAIEQARREVMRFRPELSHPPEG